jgi:hypothetical protein
MKKQIGRGFRLVKENDLGNSWRLDTPQKTDSDFDERSMVR